MADPIYPLDSKRTLEHEEVDEEGYTVRTWRLEKNGEVEHVKIRTKWPLPKDPPYPLDANRTLVKESIDEEGYTVRVFELEKNGQHALVTYRSKNPRAAKQ